MSKLKHYGLLMVLFAPLVGYTEPTEKTGNADAKSCSTCHQGPMALDRWSAEELRTRLNAVVGGTKAHPPLALSDTSDAGLTALVLALDPENPEVQKPQP